MALAALSVQRGARDSVSRLAKYFAAAVTAGSHAADVRR